MNVACGPTRNLAILLAAALASATASGEPIFAGFAHPVTPEGEPLIVETFHVLPSITCCWSPDLWDSEEKRNENDRSWREAIAAYGIAWPEGSYLYHVPAFDALVIRNTQENLAKLKEILGPCCFPQRMAWIQASIWLVEPQAALEIGLDEGNGELSPEEWTALRTRLAAHEGAEFLSCPAVLTQNEQEATTKGSLDCTYPTGFSVVAGTDGAFAVKPEGFEVREVGERLQAVPSMNDFNDSMVLTFCITTVREPSWRDWSDSLPPLQEKEMPGTRDHAPSMKTPDFPCAEITSSMVVRTGVFYQLGGMPLDDPARGRRLMFAFLSAEIRRQPSVPLNLSAPKSSEIRDSGPGR